MAIAPFSLTTTKGYTSRSYQQTGASGQVLWDNIHDGAGNGSGSEIRAGWREGVNWDALLYRGYLGFDTSSIPDTAIITDAYVKISGTENYRNYDSDCYIGSAGTTNSFADNITTTNYGTWTSTGGVGTGANTFSNIQVDFNSTGRSAINKTGDTKLSWRNKLDQTDSGITSADSYNYVDITGATLYVTYQADITKTVTETITVTDSLTKIINKVLTETIKMNSWVVGRGQNVVKLFTETFSITDSVVARVLQNFTKVLTETITVTGSIALMLNGVAISVWSKVGKTAASWTATAKKIGSWNKINKEI